MTAPAARETDGFVPGGRVRGAIEVGPSKSAAQRVLALAALAEGTTRIVGLAAEVGQDVAAALELARALGARPARENAGLLTLTSAPRGAPAPRVEVLESATTARFALALLALGAPRSAAAELVPAGSLLRRSSVPLVRALRAAGARLVASADAPVAEAKDADGGFAWRIEAIAAPPRLELATPVSSQEVSALLIALAAAGGTRELLVRGTIPSRPYLALTLEVLDRFGVRVESTEFACGARFVVRGVLTAPREVVRIEPDASSAAVALAAGCLSGGDVSVPGLDARSAQPDVAVSRGLRAFGCESPAARGELRALGLPLVGATLDLHGTPDLAPVFAALGAAVAWSARRGGRGAEALTRLRGLHTLHGKESSRVEVLARGLGSLGLEVHASREELVIAPGTAPLPLGALALDPHGDHRMAFAFALLSLVVPGVRVLDPGCVAKSWPGFWEDLEAAGARRDPARVAR